MAETIKLEEKFNHLQDAFLQLRSENESLRARVEQIPNSAVLWMTKLEEKCNRLQDAFQQLGGENESLKSRVVHLEKLSHIRALMNEKPKISFLRRMIHPYVVDEISGIEQTPPYFQLKFWKNVFAYLLLTPYEKWSLRSKCKLFRDAIQPPKIAKFPDDQRFHQLHHLVNALRQSHENPKIIDSPYLVILGQGDHEVHIRKNARGNDRNYLLVDIPITFIGHGVEMTRIVGGLEIKGDVLSAVPFSCVDLTITGSMGSGVWNTGLLPMEFQRCDFSYNNVMGLDSYKNSRWKMIDCNVTHNNSTGIGAKGAFGELINTRVTSNGNSGVRAQEASSLHMYGEKTLIEKNCSRPSKTQNLRSGLFSSDTSIIYIHEPLSLECSRNNANGNDKKGAVVVVP